MSIELRCPGCQNLLRVPDTAAGKQARCPQCQQIVNVPSAPTAASPVVGSSPFADPPAKSPEPGAFNPPAKPAAESSFASGTFQPATFQKTPDPTNPYAASNFYEHSPVATGGGVLTPQQVTFDEALQTTWKVFQMHIGPLAIVGVFVFGINMVQQVLGYIVNFSTMFIGQEVNTIATFCLQLLSFFVTPIITLGSTIPCLTLLRTGQTVPGDFMKFTNFYGRELLKTFLLILLMIPFFALVGAPIGVLIAMKEEEAALLVGIVAGLVVFVLFIFMFMSFYLSTAFIVDRNAGAIESLKLSWQFMNGNRGITFLLTLVIGLVGGLFACCTLGFGTILLTPFVSLLCTVLYMLATGQRSEISPQALGEAPSNVEKVGLPTGL